MTIELNGEPVELPPARRSPSVVERAGAGGERRGVAVAVDGEVVPRSAWDDTELATGKGSRWWGRSRVAERAIEPGGGAAGSPSADRRSAAAGSSSAGGPGARG